MAANDDEGSPRNLRSMLFDTIAHGAQIQEIEGGQGVPGFFILIGLLYSHPSRECLITENNLLEYELRILREDGATFLNALVLNFQPYTGFEFTKFPDNTITVGMRYYRLELLPVIMKVVDEEAQHQIEYTVLYHARIEAYMHDILQEESQNERDAARNFDYEKIDLEKEYSLED